MRASLVLLAVSLGSGCILDRSGTRVAGQDGGADAAVCVGVDLSSDPANCGICGHACPSVATGTPRCEAGACVVECAVGRGDCDGDPATGCEVDLTLDRDHCGACDVDCTEAVGPNQIAGGCVAGLCQARCADGFADCDGDPTNGCEAHLADARELRRLWARVPAAPNGQPVCVAGACTVQCDDARFLDCNGDPGDGCEVDGLDAFRCGVCPGGVPPAEAICGVSDFCECDPMTGCRCQFL